MVLFFAGFFLQFRSEYAYERACRLSTGKVLRSFKDDIPWMFPAAVWADACHGKLSHLVVSFVFFYSQQPVFFFFKYCELCVCIPIVLSASEL